MTSTTSKATTMEVVKPQASSPNFVLTLLAACSSAVPTNGKEGEATLADQLSGLLQDKVMAVNELKLLYSYRFGFSINDALKFAGFEGNLQEFADEHKLFSMSEGFISVKPVAVVTNHAPLALDELATSKGGDDETASIADTESTTDAESNHSDSDSDEVDITSWHSVGNRLVGVLGSPNLRHYEADADGVGWKVLGGRVAAALDSDDTDDGEDVDAWHDVGSRFLMACKRGNNDSQDLSPDASEWRSIGARVLCSLDKPEAEVDASEWRSVGARVLSQLDALDAMKDDF